MHESSERKVYCGTTICLFISLGIFLNAQINNLPTMDTTSEMCMLCAIKISMTPHREKGIARFGKCIIYVATYHLNN